MYPRLDRAKACSLSIFGMYGTLHVQPRGLGLLGGQGGTALLWSISMLAAEGLLKSMSSGITVLPNSLHFKLGPPGILWCLGSGMAVRANCMRQAIAPMTPIVKLPCLWMSRLRSVRLEEAGLSGASHVSGRGRAASAHQVPGAAALPAATSNRDWGVWGEGQEMSR